MDRGRSATVIEHREHTARLRHHVVLERHLVPGPILKLFWFEPSVQITAPVW